MTTTQKARCSDRWTFRAARRGALAITADERVIWTDLVDGLLVGVDSPRPVGD